MTTVLAIDPGSDKCGLAVVNEGGLIHKEVVPRSSAARTASELQSRHSAQRVIVGNGTGSAKFIDELVAEIPGCALEMVDEAFSTRRARVRFFQENPPRGLRRLIPRGLLVPDRPYDDYVAVILAEDYLRGMADG